MTHFRLLEDCRSYFQQAQASWDKYFSKWDALAKGENMVDEEIVLSDSEVEPVRRPAKRQFRKKSSLILSGKRFKSARGRKAKWKRERVQGGNSRDRKRETEIIHTAENQTNLECEDLNNKHFEADLKAIFIEILSENTNKMGMFSVLSRTFSGTGDTISNFSLSSMIMEKNGFSISPVSKTVLHSAFRNEFPLGGIPQGEISDASTRSCVNVTELHASNAHILRMRHLLNLNGEHPNINSSPREIQRLDENDVGNVNAECQEYVNKPLVTKGDSFRRLSTSKRVSNLPVECSRRKDFEAACYSSPEETLRKAFQTPSTSAGGKKESERKKSKVGKTRNTFFAQSSDEDDEDEDEGIDDSARKSLKIFCTPKRLKRSIKREERESEAAIDDGDNDCFCIFDRVKTDKN